MSHHLLGNNLSKAQALGWYLEGTSTTRWLDEEASIIYLAKLSRIKAEGFKWSFQWTGLNILNLFSYTCDHSNEPPAEYGVKINKYQYLIAGGMAALSSNMPFLLQTSLQKVASGKLIPTAIVHWASLMRKLCVTFACAYHCRSTRLPSRASLPKTIGQHISRRSTTACMHNFLGGIKMTSW